MKLVSQGGGEVRVGGGEDAHTTWLVLLIKDGRGPAGNYPLISTPLLCVHCLVPYVSTSRYW